MVSLPIAPKATDLFLRLAPKANKLSKLLQQNDSKFPPTISCCLRLLCHDSLNSIGADDQRVDGLPKLKWRCPLRGSPGSFS